MASYNTTWDIGINTYLKADNISKQIQDIGKGLPKLDLGSMLGGQTKFKNIQDANVMLSKVKGNIKDVMSVDIKSKTFFDVNTGKYIELATNSIIRYKDELGKTRNVYKSIQIDKDRFMIADDKKQGTFTTHLPVGDAYAAMGKEYNKISKLVNEAGKDVAGFLEKSKNMTGPATEKTKELGNAYLKLRDNFKEAFKKKDWPEVARLTGELEKQYGAFKQAEEGTNASSSATRGWGATLVSAIKQTVSYTFSIGLMQKAQQLLNQAVMYTIELNKEMTKIQVLGIKGAESAAEIRDLAASYSTLAKNMGATTLEVAKGSVEWLRQGKSITETQQLLKSTLMLSKLGALDSAQATEYLTAITNGFKVSAQDTETIVDKLIAVDNIAATSSGELATALRYTSVSAQEAGVSFEQLTSYIATVSSVTRAPAESIGQAFKTMFARMTGLKEGGLDETGIGINKVESALHSIGVELRDGQESFRGMGDVLEETAQKWASLTSVEKVNISTSIAGVRQKEMFLVLMNNMSMSLDYQTAMFNAAGLSEERYAVYMASIEGKMNTLRATMESITQQTMDSSLITMFLDWALAISKTVDEAGGLMPVLIKIGAALLFIYAAQIKAFGVGMLSSLKSMALALVQMLIGANATAAALGVVATEATIATAGFNLLAAALAASVYALGNAWAEEGKKATKAKENYELAKTALQEYMDLINGIDGAINETGPKLFETFEKLKAQKNSVGLTKTETDEYYKIIAQIAELDKNAPTFFNPTSKKIDIMEGYTFDVFNDNLLAQKVLTHDALRGINDELNAAALEHQNAIAKRTEIPQMVNLQEELSTAITGGYDFESIINTLEDTIPSTAEGSPRIKKFIKDTLQKGIDEGIGSLEPEQQTNWLVDSLGIGKSDAELDKAVYDTNQAYMLSWAKYSPDTREQIQNAMLDYWRFDEEALSVWENNFKYLNSMVDAAFPEGVIPEDILLPDVDRARQQMEELGGVFDTFTTSVTTADYGNQEAALKGLLDTIDNLNVKIDTDKLKNFDDFFSGGTIDTEGVRAYINVIIEAIGKDNLLIDENGNVADSFARIAQSVRQVGLAGEYLNQTQWASYSKDLAEQIWNGVEAAGQSSVVLNGIMYTSANQVWQTLQKYPEMLSGLIASLASSDIAYLQQVGAVAQTIFSQTAQGLPFISAWPTAAGGGGGGGGQSEEQKAAQAEIKLLEGKKAQLQKELEVFREYIDARKEALKLQKEEEAFIEKITKKNKELAKTRTNILLLSLDDSEEAGAKRLELEQEAVDLSEEIENDKQDRIYELQMAALDKQMAMMEKSTQKQLEAIDAQIAKIQELSQSMAGGGGGGTTEPDTVIKSLEQQALEAGLAVQTLMDKRETLKGLMEEETNVGEKNAMKKEIEDITAALPEMTANYSEALGQISTENQQVVVATVGVYKDKLEEFGAAATEDYSGIIKEATDTLPDSFGIVGDVMEGVDGNFSSAYNSAVLLADQGTILKTVLSDPEKTMMASFTDLNSLLGPSETKGTLGYHVRGIKDDVITMKGALQNFVDNWNSLGDKTITLTILGAGTIFSTPVGVKKPGSGGDVQQSASHFGGLAFHGGGLTPTPADSGGQTIGGLRSNEVFAKLLKGEYVATEGQMDGFLKTTLPKILTGYMPDMQKNTMSEGNTSISMPININGNMDSATLKDLEKTMNKVIYSLNDSLRRRGHVRQTTISNI